MGKESRIKETWENEPSVFCPYFLYDPNTFGVMWFANIKDRDDMLEWVKDTFLDDTWSEEVENIVAGEITHIMTETDRREKPPQNELDDEDCDEDGLCWRNFDYICDFKLMPYKPNDAKSGKQG